MQAFCIVQVYIMNCPVKVRVRAHPFFFFLTRWQFPGSFWNWNQGPDVHISASPWLKIYEFSQQRTYSMTTREKISFTNWGRCAAVDWPCWTTCEPRRAAVWRPPSWAHSRLPQPSVRGILHPFPREEEDEGAAPRLPAGAAWVEPARHLPEWKTHHGSKFDGKTIRGPHPVLQFKKYYHPYI